MHLCICYLRSMLRLDCMYYFILSFPARPFLGLVKEVDPPPINFTCCLTCLAYSHRVLFLQRCLTPWTFDCSGLLAMPDMENLSRYPLCSRGFRLIFIYLIFLEGSSKLSGGIEGDFRVTWSWGSAPIVPVVSLLYLDWLVHPVAILWLSLGGILIGTLVPFCKGLQSIWRYWFAIVSDVPGSFLPTFCYCCSLTKKFSWGDLPFSPMVFLVCCCLYSYSVEEEIIR